MSNLGKEKGKMVDDSIFPKSISTNLLSFFAKSSNLRFFKHDVLKGYFSFDIKSLEDMGLSTKLTEISEDIVLEVWGQDLYMEYIKTIKSNFRLDNYSYTSVYNNTILGESYSSKIFTVLSSNENNDLSYVEAMIIDIDNEDETSLNKSSFKKDDFRKILNNISSLVFIVDKDFNVVDYNFEGQNIFGVSALEKNKCLSLLSYFSFDIERLSEVFATNVPILGYRSNFIDVHFRQRNFIFNITKIDNVNNNTYLLFSGIDISDSLQLESRLLANESKFKSIFDQSPIGVNIYDRDLLLIDSNPAALKILDLESKNNILGNHLFNNIGLTKAEKAMVEVGEVLTISKLFDFASLRDKYGFKTVFKGEKYLEISISKIYSKTIDRDYGYIEILNDKSKDYRVFEGLQKKTEQLSMATKAGEIAVYEINLVDKTYMANIETFAMFEDDTLTRNTSMDLFLSRVHSDDLKILLKNTAALKEGKQDSFSQEYRVKVGEDQWKWIKTDASLSEYKPERGIVKVIGVNVDIDSVKKAEQRALDREELLRLTLDVGRIGLWEYDIKDDKVSLGSYLTKTLNLGHSSFKDNSFKSKDFFSIIHEDDRQEIEKGFKEFISGKRSSTSAEFRLNHLYNYQWVCLTVFINKRDVDGSPLKINGFVMNINEKTLVLEESKRVQYLLENSLKIAKVGYYYQYYNEARADISDTCCDIFRMDRESLSKLDIFLKERVHPKDVIRYKKFVNASKNDNTKRLRKINYRIIVDGEVRMITEYAKLYFDENNKRKGALYAVQDITEVYENEARLQDLLNTQRSLSEISIMMMKNLAPHELIDGLLYSVKARMKAKSVSFYLKERDLYILKNCSCISSDSFVQNKKVFKASEIDFVEKRLIRNNPILLNKLDSIEIPNEFFIDSCSSLFLPIFVSNEYYGFLLIHLDIQSAEISYEDISIMNSFVNIINLAFEKLHSQSELVEAKDKAEESDRLKSAFLRNMSHEINTPLNSIVGFSNLIVESAQDSGGEIAEYSKVLIRNTEQLLNVVNNVIDYSEIESSVLNVCSKASKISDICKEVYERYSHESFVDLDFIYEESEEELIINTDSLRLKQVLLSLVSNALKFTNKGKVVFGFKQDENRLIFYVFDTGIGISEKDKESIFEGFYQIDKMTKGVGLGLSIAKAIVNKLQGDIWFESRENEGTKFFFSIPIQE